MGVKQLSNYIGISINTIYAWCHQRKIPFSKINGKLIFDKKEIDKWISANHVAPCGWSEKFELLRYDKKINARDLPKKLDLGRTINFNLKLRKK